MDRATAQRLQSEMNDEVKKIQGTQTKLQSLMSQRAKLLTQESENSMVSKELTAASDDATVYKLQGPVLVKVEASEARANVEARLKFFKEEIARLDRQQKELEDVRKASQDKIMAIQERVRKAQQEQIQQATR